MRRPILFVVFFLVGACDPENPCPPGWNAVRGACFDPDAAVDTGTPQTCDPEDPYSGFGVTCAEQDSCECAADVCNTNSGVCTRINCHDDASICPSGWTCLTLPRLPEVPPDVLSMCFQSSR